MRLYALIVLSVLIVLNSSAGIEFKYNKQLETDVLKGYNNKHRPVKSETTAVQVQIFMSITHVEKVDEKEQTMMVHGHLWATWLDEYLTWIPAAYNDTEKLNIDAWRIWQPALALYNSARGNSWYLYMNGMPAVVNYQGKVWASGAFSFYVTCRFDFSRWPYDTQECPIVISDWVYDLSRVNLSDPGEIPWKNPLVKLNYDPQSAYEKRHVSALILASYHAYVYGGAAEILFRKAGWEVFDTWRKHCYWGPSGCKEEIPEGQPEWYWSLLEFGVRLKRHSPYLGILVLLPTVLACAINLLTFWIDTWATAITLIMANVMLQGIFGWDLIRQLPPGSGNLPRIVVLYGSNLTLTTVAFMLHVSLNYWGYVIPSDMSLPIQIDAIPRKLRMKKFFDAKGLSFDPQSILQAEHPDESQDHHSPLASIQSSDALEQPAENDEENLIPMEESNVSSPRQGSGSESQPLEFNIPIEEEEATQPTSEEPKAEVVQEAPVSKIATQLHYLRRLAFCLFVLLYLFLIPYGIL